MSPGPLASLVSLRARRRRTWLGLMSGTSCDGIDAALVTIEETDTLPRVLDVTGRVFPFADGFGEELRTDLAGSLSVERAARWDARLAEQFAEAAHAALREVSADAIAMSGHTFAHLPNATPPTTLQLGNPAVVARRTGLPTVAGFRASDIARGGEGAPLVPAGDRILFGEAERNVVVLNVGGISNATWLPRGFEAPAAADCGPGNLVLDRAYRLLASTPGRGYDVDGRLASTGRPHAACVERWLDHPFLTTSDAGEWRRSTGREEFGEPWVDDRIESLRELGPADALATLVDWIARCIQRSLIRLGACLGTAGASPDRLLVGGGGAHHLALVRAIAEHTGAKVEPLDSTQHTVGADLREAAAFALLGNEWLMGRPGSFPNTTGCADPGPLGACHGL